MSLRPIQARLLQMYKKSLGAMSSKEAFFLSLNYEWLAETEPESKMKAHFSNECNVFLNYSSILELNGE